MKAEKNKIGRPPAKWSGGEEMKHIGIRIPKTVWFKFKMQCLMKGVGASEMIFMLIDNFLKEE